MSEAAVLAADLVDLWFGPLSPDGNVGPDKRGRWFKVDPAFDKLLAKRYGEYTDPALMGAFDSWTTSDLGLVALMLLLDQIPRNIYRGQARAFYYDRKALVLALGAYETGKSFQLPAVHAAFTLMPLMHAEDLEVQDRSVEAFEGLLALYRGSGVEAAIKNHVAEAHRHRDLIQRFGRFPGRNAALNRASSDAELEFLQKLPSS